MLWKSGNFVSTNQCDVIFHIINLSTVHDKWGIHTHTFWPVFEIDYSTRSFFGFFLCTGLIYTGLTDVFFTNWGKTDQSVFSPVLYTEIPYRLIYCKYAYELRVPQNRYFDWNLKIDFVQLLYLLFTINK